jgi:hypothetical protein
MEDEIKEHDIEYWRKRNAKYDKRYPLARIDNTFFNDLKGAFKVRIEKGLANPFNRCNISSREMTELVARTNSWKGVLEELKTKPKGNNNVKKLM